MSKLDMNTHLFYVCWHLYICKLFDNVFYLYQKLTLCSAWHLNMGGGGGCAGVEGLNAMSVSSNFTVYILFISAFLLSNDSLDECILDVVMLMCLQSA